MKKDERKCIMIGCDNKLYAKSLCHTHYAWVLYAPKRKRCNAPGCNKMVVNTDYCYLHKQRAKKNLPLDLSIDCRLGKYNYRWSGGVSPFKKERLFRKNRKIKLKINPVCEECRVSAAFFVTHKKDKNNHDLSNLLSLCPSCCIRNHSRYPKHAKFYKICGKSLRQIFKHYGGLSSLLYYYVSSYGPIKSDMKRTETGNTKKFYSKFRKICNKTIVEMGRPLDLLYLYIKKYGLPKKSEP